MNWLKLTIVQLNRIFGTDSGFKEDMTEAETVNHLEGITPLSEQLSSLQEGVKERDSEIAGLNSQIAELNEKLSGNEKEIAEVKETAHSSVETLTGLIQGLRTEVATLRKETGDQFNTLKQGTPAPKTDGLLVKEKDEKPKDGNKIDGSFIDQRIANMRVSVR